MLSGITPHYLLCDVFSPIWSDLPEGSPMASVPRDPQTVLSAGWGLEHGEQWRIWGRGKLAGAEIPSSQAHVTQSQSVPTLGRGKRGHTLWEPRRWPSSGGEGAIAAPGSMSSPAGPQRGA